MDKPLVSVIVPAYNIEKYISRCLDSIRAQSYSNLEIIVIDDGSTDNTGEIIDEYATKDRRILSIHQLNKGVTKARFAGIDKACGVYVGFVDGDDFIEPNMFEKLIENAISYNADISHCGYQMIFPDNHIDFYYGSNKFEVQDHEKGLLELLRGTYIEPTLCNKLYRRYLFKSEKLEIIYNDDIKINEDLLLNYVLFSEANISVFEDCCLYHYMLRDGSATKSVSINNVLDPLKVIELIKNNLERGSNAYKVVYNRYLRILIRISQQRDFEDEAAKARNKLIQTISNPEEFHLCESVKLRLMVYANVYTPRLYKIIRYIYDVITKRNKKYSL